MTDDPAARLASLRAARDTIDREIALLSEQVDTATVVSMASPATTDVEPDWITLEQAAPLRGVTRETMARHAEIYGLGICIGRRWRIDRNRVLALNEGRKYQQLRPFPDRETSRRFTTLHDSPDAAGPSSASS